MAGHSHWAGIKHKKSIVDAKRGKLFSKLAKNIMIAIKEGGPDPSTNLRLRYAIDKAKEANMPKSNIEKIIKKMTGEAGNESLVELIYEGYGPGGTAIMVEAVTDNRNRTAGTLRKVFETNGGKMGESGCVAYLFERKGVITIPTSAIGEEELLEIILDAGADDMKNEEEYYEITTPPTEFHQVKKVLEEKNLPIKMAELAYLPKTTVKVEGETAQKVLNLISQLEEHEDVQNVYSNFDIDKEVMEKFSQQS